MASEPTPAPDTERAGDPSSDASILVRREALAAFQEAQRASAELLFAGLPTSPRRRLLVEDRMLWLLKVDAGRRVGDRRGR